MKYAVIDIGSNSVRLMLWANGTLYKKVITTRLAQGLAASGMICDEASARTVAAIAELAAEGRREGAQVLAFATAAVRSARNGSDFCARVKEACGIEVDVVAGEEEALLGIYGALGTRDGGTIDIGGASTEVCIRAHGKISFVTSLNIGVVRLFDRCGQDADKLRAVVREEIAPLAGVACAGTIYAIGGTASTLASVRLGLTEYDAAKLNGLSLSADYLDEVAAHLLALTVEERKQIPGMDLRRADVIADGAVLLSEIVHAFGLNEVKFSDGDNLEGYLVARGLA